MTKRVTILGAGESGTGAAILAKVKGYDVFVSDLNLIKDKYKNDLRAHEIEAEEGKHTEEKILSADLIIKSPGIPDKAEIIRKVKDRGLPIIDEIEFAYSFLKGKTVAITGTNGKTTTTLLTYHLMKTSGFNVTLAGNVGESFARKVALTPHDWYVIEVSSFQLDGTVQFRPDIGILLNITPDHLDRYEYKLQNYVDSKFRLIANMTADDRFIYFADDTLISAEIAKRKIEPQRYRVSLHPGTLAPVFFDGEKMCFHLSETFDIAQVDTTLKGKHNLVNTMAAVSAVQMAGGKVNGIREGLKTFRNAPHRLEHVATIDGVEFVNDSKATNVDSVVYALGSYQQPLVWIAGGIDKGNDYNLIRDEVARKVKALICLGVDNSKLKKAFEGAVPKIIETTSVQDCVEQSMALAEAGDVVLLSPACASFDLFKNYEDRGNQFKNAVLELEKTKHKV